MSKPFVRIGIIEKPKNPFDETVQILREAMEIEGFERGGIHRWSPEAYSFEFHHDRVVSLLLQKRWENVWALPLLKVGVYLEEEKICLNLRRPAWYLDLLAPDLDGKARWEIERIFRDFSEGVVAFFREISPQLGIFTLVVREEGFALSDARMAFLSRLKRSRDILTKKRVVPGEKEATVTRLADRVVRGFDELEGWKIIDRRAYRWGVEDEFIHFIEFCTPKYAGISMEMNRIYNLLLPCLGSVRSEGEGVSIAIYRPTFMFRPLFWSVDPDVRRAHAGFPAVVEEIIRSTCLKFQEE